MGLKYDQLDLDERIEMSRLYEAGTSRREIGRIIGRSASTVGRELRAVGVYEFVTAPFSVPAGYQPILRPEYPWHYFE
ncbi:MAG: helix-turn-helix domain-containing protein [Rhodoplanes sp.]